MANAIPLTVADQALANAIYCLAEAPITVSEDENLPMLLEILRELIGQASRDHPNVAPLIESAEVILMHHADKKLGYVSCAFFEARYAARAFAFWRLGEALESLRGKMGEAA